MPEVTILQGDCRNILPTLPAESVDCVVTSPPYWNQRDYSMPGQIGLEAIPICNFRKGGQKELALPARPDLTMDEARRLVQLTEEMKGLLDLAGWRPCGKCYVCVLVEIFREVRRVLKPKGTLWLNLGDTFAHDNKWGGASGGKNLYKNYGRRDGKHAYAAGTPGGFPATRQRKVVGLPSKSLIGIPWRVAFALQDDGWLFRSDIVWAKPCPMPESVKDRPSRSHEYIFLFSKQQKYYCDMDAIAEPATWQGVVKPLGGAKGRNYHPTTTDPNYRNGSDHWGREIKIKATRNRRDVWTVASQPYKGSHFAVFPQKLVEPCVLAGCPAGGTVLDPFAGSGTVGRVAAALGRDAMLIELNPNYIEQIEQRTAQVQLRFLA